MPPRRRVTRPVPASAQGAADEGRAEAAAVLASMPEGQAQLHWLTQAASATETGTGGTLAPTAAATRGARPPLADGPSAAGALMSMTLHLPGLGAQAVGGGAPRGRAGAPYSTGSAGGAPHFGTPPRVTGFPGRAPPYVSPSATASRKGKTPLNLFRSPVSVSAAAASGGTQASVSPLVPIVPAPAVAQSPTYAAASATALPPAMAPPAANSPMHPDESLPPVSMPPYIPPSSSLLPSQPFQDVAASSPVAGSHPGLPSSFTPALHQRPLAGAATTTKPRLLTFRAPQRATPATELTKSQSLPLVGEKSLTPAPAGATPKTQKPIRKKPTKPRAKRAKKPPAAPVGQSPGSTDAQPGASPAAVPTAGGARTSNAADTATPEPPQAPVGRAGVTVADLTKVLGEGLRPLCAHLVSLSRKLEEVQTTVNRMSTSMHNQGVGNERTARAVVQLQGAVKGAVSSAAVLAKTEPGTSAVLCGGTSFPSDLEERLVLATHNEAEVSAVRECSKKTMRSEIMEATSSYLVMPSRARAQDILFSSTQSVRNINRAAAEEYLDSRRVFLLANGAPAGRRTRVSEKLNRVRSHVFEKIQKVAMLAYFKALGVDTGTLVKDDAEKWLAKDKYANSPKANDAVKAALTAVFLRNGAHRRVVEPKGVGEEVYVDASTGHVALITHWARGVFEKVVGCRKARRNGNDDCAYDCWRDEVRLVSGFLRRHVNVENGLRVCDATDKRRAMVVADDGSFIVDVPDGEESAGVGLVDDGDELGEDGDVVGEDGDVVGEDGDFTGEDDDFTGEDDENGDVAGELSTTFVEKENTVLEEPARVGPLHPGGPEQVGGGGEESGHVPGVLAESSAYPQGFAEYLEEEPLL